MSDLRLSDPVFPTKDPHSLSLHKNPTLHVSPKGTAVCCCLDVKCLPWACILETPAPQLMVLFGKILELSGGGTWLEERRHWGRL